MIPIRVYTVNFTASATTASTDFFEVTNTSASGLVLVGLDVGQTTELGDSQEEQIGWYIKRASGSFTSGSGGTSSVTPRPVRQGDAAATFTAETLNTTQIAAGSGTLTTIFQSAFNLRVGLQIFWTPETAMTCATSQALAIGTTAAPADSVTWVGTAYIGELLP